MNPSKLALSILSCCSLFGLLAQAQTQTVTYSYNGATLAIPPANANVGATAEIYVPTALTLNSVTAQLRIAYPSIGDLVIYLFSANGTRTIILNNDCGSLVNVDTTFDDNAPSKYSDFCPAEAGRGPFRPDQPLANSKGEISAGYWDLFVQNTKSNSRSGTIQAFSLTFTGAPVTTPAFSADSVTNSASLIGGIVAPGELVSIFGVALGPQTGVQANSGTLPTTLGGTTVMFDGTPAPILYSSYNQLNVQAPFTLNPGSSTRIQVQSPGGTSSSISVDVLSSVAGLFTTSETNGRGQALILNQAGTVNSASNPAPAGSYVSLYATGLGPVTPTVNAGTAAPTSPLSTVNGGVTVVVAGLTAPVLYAGLAPGFAGLYQINIQIPSTTASGARRVFLITANGYSSQAGVFLQVQ